MRCHDTTLALGVYALGALDPAERSEVERHLSGCAGCLGNLAELAGLPELLATVTPEEAGGSRPAPPPQAYRRLVSGADVDGARHRPAGGRRRWSGPRRRLRVAAAALSLLAGVGGGVGIREAFRAHPESYAATDGPVRMSVRLIGQTSGTGLDVTVSGLLAGQRCRLIAVAADGTRQLAGSWQATYAGRAWVNGATATPQNRLTQLILLGSNDRPLVTVRV